MTFLKKDRKEIIYKGNGEFLGVEIVDGSTLVEYFDEFGNKVTKRVREEIAIAFQHEIDHLDGIMFTDRIDKKEPYKNQSNMRAI